jgi:erythromycin esterase-like protein
LAGRAPREPIPAGENSNPQAIDPLGEFERFPSWMWRNANVLDFVGRLRAHNDSLQPKHPKAGFYGMDLYRMHPSVEAVRLTMVIVATVWK